MKDKTDELLWDLSTRRGEGPSAEMTELDSAGDGRPAISNETLRAYRADELDDAEMQRVEQALASDPALRRTLAGLAGVEPLTVSDRLRRELLAPTTGRDRSGAGSQRTVGTVPGAVAAKLIAAVLTIGLGVGVFYVAQLEGPGGSSAGSVAHGSSPDLRYEVHVEAEATLRSEAPGSRAGETRVYPETRVRVVLQPEGEPVPGVAFAVYRLTGAELVRVADRDVEIEAARGAATLTANASDLTRGGSGEHRIFFVAARRAELPAGRIPVLSGDDPLELLSGEGRSVHEHTLTFASEPDGS